MLDDSLLAALERQIPQHTAILDSLGLDPREARVRRVCHYLSSHRGERLTLRHKSRRQGFKLEAGGSYLLGIGSKLPWQLSPTEGRPPVMSFAPFHAPFDLLCELHFTTACFAFPFLFSGAVFDTHVRIPAQTTVFTNLQTLRFDGGLTMDEGAKLYGLHPCGLDVRAAHFQGSQAFSVEAWPLISCSIKSTNEQTPSLTPVGGDGLYEAGDLVESPHGRDGDAGADGESPEASSGLDGFCGTMFRAAGDGESFDDSDAAAATAVGGTGLPGVPGVDGRPLGVHFQSAQGDVRLQSSGGDGGKGGAGGEGASFIAGAGGDMPWLCGFFGAPGSGGTATRGGDGGSGGVGGDGGSGGSVELRVDDYDDANFRFRACVKGGEPGAAGSGGQGGVALGGVNGAWLGAPFVTPFSYNGAGQDGERGQDSDEGMRGANGSITLNGETVLEANFGTLPQNFRYPSGDIVVGVAPDCWN